MLTVRDVMALGDCQKLGQIKAKVLKMISAPDIIHIYGTALKVHEEYVGDASRTTTLGLWKDLSILVELSCFRSPHLHSTQWQDLQK